MAPAVLVFDLDDTLLRSFPPYAELHRRVAADLGWPVPTIDELVPYGHDWRETLSRLFPGRSLDAFIRRYDERAHELPYEEIPGARRALEELHAAGHALYVVTKRDRTRLAARLAEAGLPSALFTGIFPREAQPEPKPSPRCFEPLWAALGVAGRRGVSAEVLYVGDRREDLVAARAAGLGFVAVRSGPETRIGFPWDHPAESTLESVAELPRWLARAGS